MTSSPRPAADEIAVHGRTIAASLLAVFALAFAPPAKRISLDVKDADLHNVVRLLADVGHINIVVPDDVKAKVTIQLRDVPWTEALDAILRSKGLGQERIGDVIEVDTEARILKRLQLAAEIRSAKAQSVRLATVMIPLRYARASEVAPLVKGMLTERGRLEIDARTNTLIVTDVADAAAAIEQRMRPR